DQERHQAEEPFARRGQSPLGPAGQPRQQRQTVTKRRKLGCRRDLGSGRDLVLLPGAFQQQSVLHNECYPRQTSRVSSEGAEPAPENPLLPRQGNCGYTGLRMLITTVERP